MASILSLRFQLLTKSYLLLPGESLSLRQVSPSVPPALGSQCRSENFLELPSSRSLLQSLHSFKLTITMQTVRSLYDYAMLGLKMEQLNEGLINLARIEIMLIIILIIFIVSLIILGLSLKRFFDMSAKI